MRRTVWIVASDDEASALRVLLRRWGRPLDAVEVVAAWSDPESVRFDAFRRVIVVLPHDTAMRACTAICEWRLRRDGRDTIEAGKRASRGVFLDAPTMGTFAATLPTTLSLADALTNETLRSARTRARRLWELPA